MAVGNPNMVPIVGEKPTIGSVSQTADDDPLEDVRIQLMAG